MWGADNTFEQQKRGAGEREGPSEDKTQETAIKNKDGSGAYWIVPEHRAAREPPEKTTAVSLGPFAADLNGKETDDDGSDEIITHVARSP